MNSKRKSVHKPLIAVLALFTAFALTSCNVAKHGPVPGTLRINIGTEPPGIDWEVETDSTSFDVVSNLMTGLTQYTPDLKAAPACAKSWEVLDGGKTYLFHLREDIYWTDGKKLTAKDFEYAWKRLLNPATGAQYAYFLYPIVNAFEFNSKKITDSNLVGIKALDDYTFEVKLNKPAAYFIYLTAFCPCCPSRQDVIEKWGRRWTDPEHIVTNGPFMLKHWAHEYKIELVRNPKYFEGLPKLEKISMFMVPEQSTAFALYENDELDFIDNRSFSTPDVERCKDSPEYKNVALLRSNYVGFNVTKPPFTDPRVRRAVSKAIDRNVYPKILRRNERPTSSWIPYPLAGYSPTTGEKFDPVGARKLLAEAGFPGGKGFPPVVMLYPNRDDVKTVVEELQDQLQENLGISVGLQNQEWKVYLQTLHRDPPPIFRANWGADYPDPETFANLFTSFNGNNTTEWKDKKYDAIVEKAGTEQDPEKRKKLYEQADHYLCNEECVIAPVYMATQSSMVKPWVKGLKFNALDIQFYKEVIIEP
jgi:oligopeptide transport system substrate-binding protein